MRHNWITPRMGFFFGGGNADVIAFGIAAGVCGGNCHDG